METLNDQVQKMDYEKMSATYGLTDVEIATIQATVAKGTSKVELAYFLSLAKSVGLNPFNKEIWCYKDNKGNLLIFSGRDGFLKKAQENPSFNGMRSSEVCENDTFGIDVANNVINHTVGVQDRGKIIGAYAIVFRKDGEPTVEWVQFDAYNKGFNAWKTHPAEMIKKVAESHALKKAFGITGVLVEYDYDTRNNTFGAVKTLPKLPDQYFRKLMLSVDSRPDDVREVLENVDFDLIQKEQIRQKLNESITE
jgi:phage recombination protein Bet